MESNADNHRKLKNYLILPKFQLKFIALLMGTNILIALMILVSIYLFLINSSTLYGVLQYMHSDTSINFRAELYHFFILLGCLSVVFFSFIGILALVLSHRAAGPVYQFKLIYDKVAEGHFDERIYLRPKDDFQEAAISFNKMMDTIEKKS